ncbi:MAG: hypothetical protein KF690_02725 [Bacteroidetes bacterium]|nr:hypothetical protein [Bacteroidota bacterium]
MSKKKFILFAVAGMVSLAVLSSCGSGNSMLTAKDCPNGIKKNNHKIDRP